METMQYGDHAIWRPCNMETMQCGDQAIWRPCNVETMQYGDHAMWISPRDRYPDGISR
jgi:hypothetical protein